MPAAEAGGALEFEVNLVGRASLTAVSQKNPVSNQPCPKRRSGDVHYRNLEKKVIFEARSHSTSG